jgi:hypothetical protein
MQEGTFVVRFPRSDLNIRINGEAIPTGLGFGGWAAFKDMGKHTMVMGDLVLLQEEVNPVIKALRAGGLEVVAVHNHMLTEQPRAFFLHYWGSALAENLAHTVRTAFDLVKGPAR